MLAMIYGAQNGPLKLLQENGVFVLEDQNGQREVCLESSLSDIVDRLRGTERPFRAITVAPNAP